MTRRREPKSHRKETDNYAAFAGQSCVGQSLGHRRNKPLDLLSFLLERQRGKGFVSKSDIIAASQACHVSQATAFGVGTFYSMLNVIDQTDHSLLDAKENGSIEFTPSIDHRQRLIRVCDGPSCCLRGSIELHRQLSDLATESQSIRVTRTSCLGKCEVAPAVTVDEEPFGPVQFDPVLFDPVLFDPVRCDPVRCDAARSSSQLAVSQLAVSELESLSRNTRGDAARNSTTCLFDNHDRASQGDAATRTPLTARFGAPTDLTYDRLKTARNRLPLELIDEIERSDLRGRGGAGFNAGKKWRMVATSPAIKRFVVCNADESEPGTFKDRVLMECDPHLLFEGMAICAYAVEASDGIIYIRGEYSHAAEVLRNAIVEARQAGVLGTTFDITIHQGAGAYICGEETALLESLEGKRGEPRSRPPFPTTNGFLGFPTVVNNVETFCSVPFIIERGAQAYHDLGRGNAAGTKLFCLSGHVARPGVCEAPLGITTRELLDDYAEGMQNGRQFKLAVTGGAAGTFITSEMLDIPLSFDSWKESTSSERVAMGSGGIIIADDTVNAVTMLLWILRFFELESCGKCTPCRIGTHQARQIVDRIANSGGQVGDIRQLQQLATTLDRLSFCGLGQSASWPIESCIQRFRADFEELGAT